MSDRMKNDSEYLIVLYNRIYKSMNPESLGVEKIAHLMGRSAVWLYKLIAGEIGFIPEDIPALYNATKDKKLLDWLIDKCDGVSLRYSNPGAVNGDFDDDLEQAVDQVGDLFKARRSALVDGKIDGIEREQLLDKARSLRDVADTIEAEIKRYGM